ncbi:MAG: TIGR01244 family phosphatase [Gammaproteobacteria bacterium]|nr:TIGR01244 family phosphatase [Pseudohongiella sp.]MAY56826.1 TIGR01244 family phosphatase [Gammaproteobacteria bacterium]MBJ56549.1 TIGR01244 family phosphatase [Gammaproteobacteria bacterium]HBN15270.1 TIGR01244 family phosphatase [Pseudohongiella sp.]|tara:strand:- start:246 stop:674 length:429 start_codon:yes stop_codon:yes gene_type:complete
MKAKQVTDEFAVAEQLTADDVDMMAAAGFKTIICNRPDGEAAGQPLRAEIQAVAEDHGMQFRYIPVVSGELSLEDVAAFSEALDNAPRPVLAYCRSGTRSIQLWGLASGLKGMAPEAVVSHGAEAGYDLRGVAGWLAQQSQG